MWSDKRIKDAAVDATDIVGDDWVPLLRVIELMTEVRDEMRDECAVKIESIRETAAQLVAEERDVQSAALVELLKSPGSSTWVKNAHIAWDDEHVCWRVACISKSGIIKCVYTGPLAGAVAALKEAAGAGDEMRRCPDCGTDLAEAHDGAYLYCPVCQPGAAH